MRSTVLSSLLWSILVSTLSIDFFCGSEDFTTRKPNSIVVGCGLTGTCDTDSGGDGIAIHMDHGSGSIPPPQYLASMKTEELAKGQHGTEAGLTRAAAAAAPAPAPAAVVAVAAPDSSSIRGSSEPSIAAGYEAQTSGSYAAASSIFLAVHREHRGLSWTEVCSFTSPTGYLRYRTSTSWLGRLLPQLHTERELLAARGWVVEKTTEFGDMPWSVASRGGLLTSALHKLNHDVEQLEYLLLRGKLPDQFQGVLEGFRAVRDGVQARSGATRDGFLLLSSGEVQSMRGLYNTPLYLPPPPPQLPPPPPQLVEGQLAHTEAAAAAVAAVAAVASWRASVDGEAGRRVVEHQLQQQQQHQQQQQDGTQPSPLTQQGEQQQQQQQQDDAAGRVLTDMINPLLDFHQIEDAYFSIAPGVTFIDDFLTPQALELLLDYCRETTVWYDVKPGYLGAYFNDGFSGPLLLQLADELPLRFPRIFKQHKLENLWGYKYDGALGGIGVHVDNAAVNVNFWLAPDEANLDPSSGGLVVYTREPPLGESIEEWNDWTKKDKMMAYLEEVGHEKIVVPHRQNRMVMFHSNLLHETDTLNFRPGYLNRRINLTYLYGKREVRSASSP